MHRSVSKVGGDFRVFELTVSLNIPCQHECGLPCPLNRWFPGSGLSSLIILTLGRCRSTFKLRIEVEGQSEGRQERKGEEEGFQWEKRDLGTQEKEDGFRQSVTTTVRTGGIRRYK